MRACDSQSIRKVTEGLGFALIGVAPAVATEFAQYIRRWLGEGKHGQMAYLANNLPLRLDPKALLPAARSIICVADRYPADHIKSEGSDGSKATFSVDPGQGGSKMGTQTDPVGRIARYAWGNDYHRVIKKRLFKLADGLRGQWPDHQYKVAVDTAPILEREHAQRAGLGWVGKHTLLIHPQQGSWLLLGQIVTTLPIQIDASRQEPMEDHCGTCTRCIDACPTDCLTPYELDAQRCISYLTLEHRGAIDLHQHRDMGHWIAGCDVCQEVCPYNQPERLNRTDGRPIEADESSFQADYAIRPPGPVASLVEILNWDEAARRRVLRISALKRVKLDMFKRNALIAAGNVLESGPNETLRHRIHQMAEDRHESELVRLTARQVIKRLAHDAPAGDQSPLLLEGRLVGQQGTDDQGNLCQRPDDHRDDQAV